MIREDQESEIESTFNLKFVPESVDLVKLVLFNLEKT